MKYLNFFVSVLLSLLYIAAKIPPAEKFNLWITSFMIPLALAINFILFAIALFRKKKSSFYYIIALAIGSQYLFGTFGIKHYFRRAQPPGVSFSAINYNMGGYSLRPYWFNNHDSARIALKNWILKGDADIICLEEFSNVTRSKEFNVLQQLEDAGTYYYFSTDETDNSAWSRTGTLIISSFPIVSSGDVLASENGFNRIAYADVLIERDTVRIINVHLESMGLSMVGRHHDLSIGTAVMIILNKLKTGVFERSRQIKQLDAFIDETRYPVLCLGDFNDLPYSYTYQFLRKKMKNSFEESGTGTGFTYNGRRLSGLRIDNQFYTSGLSCVEFETLDTVRFSDHFPLWGRYDLVDQK